jgi:hypothetical protein
VSSRPVSLARVISAVFLPTLIFEIGMGALAPMIVLSGRGLGASVGMAGLVVAPLGVGQILGDVPAGGRSCRSPMPAARSTCRSTCTAGPDGSSQWARRSSERTTRVI